MCIWNSWLSLYTLYVKCKAIHKKQWKPTYYTLDLFNDMRPTWEHNSTRIPAISYSRCWLPWKPVTILIRPLITCRNPITLCFMLHLKQVTCWPLTDQEAMGYVRQLVVFFIVILLLNDGYGSKRSRKLKKQMALRDRETNAVEFIR